MKEKLYSLYRHTTPSNRVYIGITCQPVEHRWNNGRGYFNTKKTPFKSAIVKYGWDNIKHEVLFTKLSEERAKQLEISLIRHYKALGVSLNYTDGGDGLNGCVPWNKGIKVPYEKSNKRKGCVLSEEHKRKLSALHKGKTHIGYKWTEEQKKQLSISSKGKHHSIETRNKIREHSAHSKSIVEYNTLGEVINVFVSIAEVSRLYGICSQWISRACKEKRLCMGHIFMFKDDVIDVTKIKHGRKYKGNNIIIQNIYTDETLSFCSLTDCAKFFNFSNIHYFRKVIDSGYLIKDAWKIIELNGEKIVYELKRSKNRPKAIKCCNIETNEVLNFPSILATKNFLKLSSATSVVKALSGRRRSNIIRGWRINYASDDTYKVAAAANNR